MDPLDDFKSVLSCDYRDTGNTSDEVLQGDASLQCLISQLQGVEFCSIAVWETILFFIFFKQKKQNMYTLFY